MNPVNPEWRTTTVVALCRRMLDSRDFDTLPILADALQDADCTDAALLAECRNTKLDRIEAERLVNLVYSDATAAAVRWLEEFAREIGYEEEDEPTYTYESIIELGQNGVSLGSMGFWTDAGADYLRSEEENLREFFKNWSLVTGVPAPEDVQDNISVHCAC